MPDPITVGCLSDLAGIRHGFFTREGGVSDGIYASLNCGAGSSDRAAAVAENRRRVARHLGLDGGERVLTLYQVHGRLAHVADRPLARSELPRADAVVTRTPGLVIGVLTADCAPVLLADPEANVIGAAHAGWRGALDGVLESAIDAMVGLGARRERIRAALGPCINQGAYEVGPEFEDRFLEASAENARYFDRPAPAARPRFDLPGYVEARLSRAGLAAVERRSDCTMAHDSRFFSFRRTTARGEPDYGRQISAIVLA